MLPLGKTMVKVTHLSFAQTTWSLDIRLYCLPTSFWAWVGWFNEFIVLIHIDGSHISTVHQCHRPHPRLCIAHIQVLRHIHPYKWLFCQAVEYPQCEGGIMYLHNIAFEIWPWFMLTDARFRAYCDCHASLSKIQHVLLLVTFQILHHLKLPRFYHSAYTNYGCNIRDGIELIHLPYAPCHFVFMPKRRHIH